MFFPCVSLVPSPVFLSAYCSAHLWWQAPLFFEGGPSRRVCPGRSRFSAIGFPFRFFDRFSDPFVIAECRKNPRSKIFLYLFPGGFFRPPDVLFFGEKKRPTRCPTGSWRVSSQTKEKFRGCSPGLFFTDPPPFKVSFFSRGRFFSPTLGCDG